MDLTDIDVAIFEGDNLIFSHVFDINVGEERNFTASWVSVAGTTTIKAVVDVENTIMEINESNNEFSEIIDVKPINPADPMIIRGKIFNRDNINIIGASVRIRNLRTGRVLNRTTNENGYRAELDPDWYQEGDEIEVTATYNDISDNATVLVYSADEEVWCNITLKTELYDALFYFKLILIFVEIIGFILVIKYAIKLRKYKKME
jgi:subtilase family serine protease